MASSPSIRPGTAVVALGLLAPALAGCGYTLERTSRIEAREQALAAAETRERSLQRRIGELTGALQAERRAAQEASEAERLALADVAVLKRRLRAARVQVADLERSRVVATDALSGGIEAEAEEARRQALRDEGEWTQQAVAGVEGRLQALRAEVAAAEADLAERQRELAGLREQIARERAGAAAPAAGSAGSRPQPGAAAAAPAAGASGSQPEGGGAPPR
jgi:chromosome segregation ATPase